MSECDNCSYFGVIGEDVFELEDGEVLCERCCLTEMAEGQYYDHAAGHYVCDVNPKDVMRRLKGET